ncbi:hypothetical protein MMC13_004305 [Lambiella insularis]|nr:hypothetical protein [Lambiella insularis]
MPRSARVIIDTDPGVDDVLAMLFALAANPNDIEILLISVTYGNVDVQNCLRNVVSMFHVIEKEIQWRKDQGVHGGFESLTVSKPLVAVGADGPLDEQLRMADYFHGADGLGGISQTHKHLTPPETWRSLFTQPPPDTDITMAAKEVIRAGLDSPSSLFTPSLRPSHLEILRLLEESPPNTIDIIAIGPLTNLALAASHSPQILLRAKSILVMGGAVDCPGNMTPLAEFNTYADATAAARLYALSSPDPTSTMPPRPPPMLQGSGRRLSLAHSLPSYPAKAELGNRRLNVVLFGLDITTQHVLRRDEFDAKTKPLIAKGSPLAEWISAFMTSIFRNMENLHHGHEGGSTSLSLHDPLCVWYALTSVKENDRWKVTKNEDIRVETAGQWTRGACIVDRRDRKSRKNDDGEGNEISGDTDGWLSPARGNRLGRCVGTPGERLLGPLMLDTIFS